MAKAREKSACKDCKSATSARAGGRKRGGSKPKTKTVPLAFMEDATFYHVIMWGEQEAVVKQHAKRAHRLSPTKKEAVSAAKDLKARNKHIFVHKADGSIDRWLRDHAA